MIFSEKFEEILITDNSENNSYIFKDIVNLSDDNPIIFITSNNIKIDNKNIIIYNDSLHYLEKNDLNFDFAYLNFFNNSYDTIREFLKLICKLKKECLIIIDNSKSEYIKNLFDFIQEESYTKYKYDCFIWKPIYLEKIKVVVSFTTIPPRIFNLKEKRDNIIYNTYNNIRIELNISKEYKRFKENINFSLLEDLKTKESKFNYYITEDYGPYSKIYPTWQRYKDTKQLIYFMDDDTCYPLDTIEIFLVNYFTKNEKSCFCGFTDIITRNPEGFIEKHHNKKVTDTKQPYVYLSFDYNKSTNIAMRANFIYGHGGCLFLSTDVNLTNIPSDCPEFYFNDDIWITYQFYNQNISIFCCPYISTNKYNLSDKGALHSLNECGKTWNICLNYCRKNGNLFN